MNLNEFLIKEGHNISKSIVEKNCGEVVNGKCLSLTTMANIISLINGLRSLILPGVYETQPVEELLMQSVIDSRLKLVAIELHEVVKNVLQQCCEKDKKTHEKCHECSKKADKITIEILKMLPTIRETLTTDIIAAYNGDPAANSYAEIVLSYPSFEAVSIHRIAHAINELDVPLIPRIMSEYAHQQTGIDIHPGAKIGESFFIDHGTGVVIGETCTIGHNVKIYQGVTLGAKSFPLDENGNPVKGIQRHPTIKDNVVIYAQATILGGDTVIGENSVIGGNVWLTHSVPANSNVFNAQPAPIIKQQ